MKNKNKIGMIAFLIMIIIPVNILNTDALFPDQVEISQNPALTNVTVNDIVKVTVTITKSPLEVRDDFLEHAELRYKIDGHTQSPIIYTIGSPMIISPSLTLTFTFEEFAKGSEIEYTIYLDCRIDYESDTYSFTVHSADSNVNINTIYVIIAIVVFVALVSIIIFKKRKK
jgi:hypothetical protein